MPFYCTQSGHLEFSSLLNSSARFVHIPSKVDPTRIVEQNKRRVAQLKLLHNREMGQLTAIKKGTF